MIRKNFKIVLPDEPYKVETTKNNQIDGWYEGPRYLVVRAKDGIADCAVAGTEDGNLDLSMWKEEGHRFFLFDVATNPLIGAYLGRTYTTGEVPNYTETLETGETYEYVYEDNTGVLDQIYFPNSVPVDDNNEFGEPTRRVHFNTRESVIDSIDVLLAQAQEMKAINDYTPDQAAELDQYIDWLTTAKERYANTEHWKIKFPVLRLI